MESRGVESADEVFEAVRLILLAEVIPAIETDEADLIPIVGTAAEKPDRPADGFVAAFQRDEVGLDALTLFRKAARQDGGAFIAAQGSRT